MLLFCFRSWLEEFWGEGNWLQPRAPCLPSCGLFQFCESPRESRCGEGARTLMGLGARGVAAAGTSLSCGLSATTDNLPPCWVLFGGAEVSRLLGAGDRPRIDAMGVFPGVLPHSALGTPTLSCVRGTSREGVGARHIALQPWELGRVGDTDGGGCLPERVAGDSCVLQGERTERGWGAAVCPLHPAWCWAALEGRGKHSGMGDKLL